MFRGFGRALEGGSRAGGPGGKPPFLKGRGEGSWEGKNQRKSMSWGIVFEPSGGRWKGGLERQGGEKSMPWL